MPGSAGTAAGTSGCALWSIAIATAARLLPRSGATCGAALPRLERAPVGTEFFLSTVTAGIAAWGI